MSGARIPMSYKPTPPVAASVPVDLFDNVQRVQTGTPYDAYDVTVRISGDILRSMLVGPMKLDGVSLKPCGRHLEFVMHAASVAVSTAPEAPE